MDRECGNWTNLTALPSDTTGDEYSISLSLYIFQIASNALNPVLIIPANIINILVLRKLPNLNVTTRLLLVCLAVVDLTTGVINAFFSLPSSITQRWLFGHGLCKLIGLAYPVTCDSSLMFIALISIDRYVAITRPLHYSRIITINRILIFICFFTIILSVGVYVLSSIDTPFDNIHFDRVVSTCLINFAHPCLSTETIAIFCMMVLQPFIIVFILYANVMRIAYRVAKKVDNLDPNRVRNKGFSRKEWKATKTTLAVTGAFSVAWLPLLISTIFTAATGKQIQHAWAFLIVILPVMNSWWNFLIYAVMNQQFRDTLKINYYRVLERFRESH